MQTADPEVTVLSHMQQRSTEQEGFLFVFEARAKGFLLREWASS